MSFLGLNCFHRARSGRKNKSRQAVQPAKTRCRNRVGGGSLVIEPLEDRRMLAVLNLGVNLLADVAGTPGVGLSSDTVNVGDTFYVEITALDVGGQSNGITGLSLDVAWDGAALELLNVPFNPVPFNGIITPNFPNARGGTLSAGQDSIDELSGESNPLAGEGFAIGNGSASRFALLRFRADAPVTASAFSVSLGDSLGGGGVLFANGDPLDTVNIDPQTITVASATPSFSINDVTMEEGDSGTKQFVFTVSVADLGANPVSVSYATNDGFATAADNDYVSTSGTLNFTPGLPGATSKTITVVVNGDTLFEGDETFTVDLSNPSANATIADGQGVGTITNDDAAGPAAFEISDAQIAEGDDGLTNMTFTVTLFNPPAQEATVHYSLLPVTASPGDNDYLPINGTLTFTPGTLGATQQTITIQIVGDTKVELDETFQVVLDSPTNAVIADGEGVGTITNDDTAVISVADVTIVEGDSGATQAMVVVSMSSRAVLPVSVMLATSDGTATTADGDYVALAQQVTIPVNQTQVVVPITINADTKVELDETFTVTISGPLFGGTNDPTRATLGAASATVTITNDDFSPTTAQLSIADVTIAEGDSGESQAMLTLTLSQTVDEDVTVTLNTASGTATVADGDFVAVIDQVVTIPANETSVTVPITINGDATVELDEMFTVALSNALVGGVSDPARVVISDATATVTIINDDAAEITINDVSQEEGNTDFDFTITLSKPVDVPITITTNVLDVTVPAGQTTHLFTVSVSNADDNNIVEGERVAEIMLTGVQAQGRNVTITDAVGEAIVLDNDSATLSINDVEQEEAVGDFIFTLTLSNPVAIDVFVTVTAPEGSDIITIPALALTQTFTVLFEDNDIVEFDGDFDINITEVDADGLPVTVSKAVGVGTILDDDFADFTISDASIIEGNDGSTFLVFTVATSNPIDADVTIEWATSDGTAAAGSDYIAASGTLSFPRPLTLEDPFVTSQMISIEILGDANIEPDETFTITLSNLMAEGLENIAVFPMNDTAIGTILDDDTPVPTLSIGDGTAVVEGDSGTTMMVFTVTLVNPPDETVQVNYQTVDGTASALDLDFADTFGTLTFPVGATEQTIMVPIIGDTLVELDEMFTVELFDASGATIGVAQGTGTITDDDSATISIADAAAVTEGDSGTVAMTFTVTLSGEVDTDVTVTVNTVDGTATGGVDFVAITDQTIAFTAGGALSQNITVLVNGDTTVEADEILSIVLSNISAGGRDVTFADDTANGEITDDDSLTISIGDVTMLEGTAGTPTAFQFPITLSAAASEDITVTVNTADGTATAAGGDYTALVDHVVTIPAGETTAFVTVEVAADSDIEEDETFTVVIGDALLGGTADPRVTIAAGEDTATGTITNDDATATVSIADVSVAEGDSGATNLVFTITLSDAVDETVTVTFNTADGTATAGTDYQGVTDHTVTFTPGGSLTQTVTIEIGGDTLVELDETIMATISNLQTAAEGVVLGTATATGTIENDDDATISIGDVTIAEGDSGTTDMTFTVTLSSQVDTDITLTVDTADGTATAGTDYTAISGQTITIAAGTLAQTFTVSVAGDTTVEANETFTVALSDLQAGGRDVTLADAEATGTITNNDSATISIANASLVEGDSGASSMMFNITLSNAVDVPVTVTLNTADGTATVANNDYVAVTAQTFTFNPGDPLTKAFGVTINGDTAVEQNETFTLAMSNVQAGGRNVSLGVASAIGTITNDDGPGTALLSIADVSMAEGNSGTTTMTFTITLSQAVEEPVTVTVNSANGTATAGTDYTAVVNQTVTIPAGSTSATVTVSVMGDTTVEANETFTLTLSNPLFDGVTNLARVALDTDNTDSVDNVATGTITNDDVATLSIANVTMAEGTGSTATPFVFTITMSNPVDRAVTVTVNTANGTATAGTDYTALTNQTVTIAAGQTTAQVTVNVIADSTVEPNETFTVALSNPLFGGVSDATRVVLGANSTATGTITDDDGTATLSGVVYVDADNDGVRDTGEVGVPGVQITLRRTDTTGTADVVMLTGNDGSYSFTNVTPGTYSIIETQPTAFMDGSESAGSAGGTVASDSITGIVVTGGASGTNYNFGEGGLMPAFVSIRNFLASTPEASIMLREINAKAAELAGNTALAQAIRSGGSSVVSATVSISDASVSEGNTGTTTMTFNVTLSSASDAPVSVTVNTANGTATTADTDYVAITNQTLTFNPGDPLTKTVTVTINGDTRVEANETLTVNLSNIQAGGRNITIADGTATGTITNDDAATVSINDATVTEGNSGTANATFTVTLSAAVDTNVSVTVNTANGTATTADNDYTAVTNQTLTFAPGTLSQTVTVPVIGDTKVEANETFNVNLSNLQASGRNVTISDGAGLGTITNNDSATISIADASVVEGDSGTTNLVFNLTMSNPVDTAVTVQATTANGTATAGADYTALSNQTITFNAGATTATVTVVVTGDTVVEPNETFTITLSNVSASGRNVTIDDGTATGTITNDDTTSASLSIADATLVEGDSGTTNLVFTVTLANPPASGSVTVDFATSNGTATAGTDYTAASGTLTFPQGTTTQTISVPILGDTVDEGDETFTVTLSNAANATIADATAAGTITDDDEPAAASLSIADATLVEGDSGTTNMVFTVSLTNPPSSGDVTVDFDTSNGTATAGTDYSAASGTLTFPQGTTTQTISVPILGDETVEADETFMVTLSNASNAAIGTATATGTISNDDTATISIADATVTEGDSGTVNATFTVTLSAAADADVAVTVNTADDTATAGTDYVALTGQTITFTAGGSLTQTVIVVVNGDTDVEGDETFDVLLSNVSAGGRNVTLADATAIGTITDDDEAAAMVSIADATVAEGTGAGTTELVFTITLSAVQSEDVTVTALSAPGSATVADGDYTIISETVTIPAGQTTATVTSTIGRDDKVELDEMFTVTISNPLLGGAVSASLTLGDATATGTITNDDSATLSVDDVEQMEALGDQTFTITLSAPVDVDVTVNFNDEISDQTITIPAGQLSAAAVAAVDDNDIVQFDFDYTVTLSNVQAAGRNVTIGDGEGLGTILDDDFADVTIADVMMEEGDSGETIFTFTVMLTNPVEANVTMSFATADGTATAGSDYVAQTGAVSFLLPPNVEDPLVTVQMITIVVNGDMDVEGDETFRIILSDLDAEGLEVVAVAFDGEENTLEATATILNDDLGAPGSIIAFAPTGGGLPGESTLVVGTSSSAAAQQLLDSQAVDAAFSDAGAASSSPLSAGNPARRSLPADEALEETIDWLAA